MKTKILLLFGAIYCCARLSAQTLDKKFASTNGSVSVTLQSGDTVYIGGDFSQVGAPHQGLARFKSGDTKPEWNFSQLGIFTPVSSVEPDGNGGFYLGGAFSLFDGVPINQTSIIHVLSDGKMDKNFGVVDASYSGINAIKKAGNRLFICGDFYYVQGEYRPYLAALDATTGALDSWVPEQPDYIVKQVEANDSAVFITGYFNHVGTSVTGNFAALNAKTGKLLPGFPSFNADVSSFKLDDNNTLYLGGNFSSLGYFKQGLGKTNATNADIYPFFPSTDGTVWCVIPDSKGGFYVGGSFNTLGNLARNNIAHILPNGNVDAKFYVNANNGIYSMVADGNTLFICGEFTSVNGSLRNHVAAVALSTGALTGFNPDANSAVTTLAIHGDTVYMGGQFTTMKGKSRNYAAAVTKNNILTTWAPDANGFVKKIVLNKAGTTAYLGGDFNIIKSKNIPYLAKVNTGNGKPYAWNPGLDGYVSNIILEGNTIYLRGAFYNINGISRRYFAAIDTTSGKATGLKADLNNGNYYYRMGYNDMNLYNGKLYLGGDFSMIQDVPRRNMARIDLASGMVDDWNSSKSISPDNPVFAICVNQDNVLFGGSFNFLSAYQRTYMAAVNISGNSFVVKSWQPSVTFYTVNSINDILHYKNEVFICGNFQYDTSSSGSYSGVSMSNLLALNDSSGKLSRRFTEYPDNPLNALTVFDNKIMVSGSFSRFYNTLDGSLNSTHYYLAGYDLSNSKLSPDKYDPNNPPKICTDKNGNLIAAGSFSLVNVVDRHQLASININTGEVTAWDPNLNGFPHALAIQDSTVYVGGSFYSVGADYQPRYNLAAINTKTGRVLTNWVADVDGQVFSLAIKDQVLYVGGDFSSIKNAYRNNAAALSVNTAAVRNWNPDPDAAVTAILPLNNSVYLGGGFWNLKGTAHQMLAKVNNTNGNPIPWQPMPNNMVYSIISSGRNIFVGGAFQQIGSRSRRALAVFDTTTNKLTSFDAKMYSDYGTEVYSLADYGKNIYYTAGQDIENVGDSVRGALAGIDTTTGIVLPFDPRPNYPGGEALSIGKNKLFAGGSWLTLGNSVAPSYFAVFTLEPQTQASGIQVTNLQTKSANVSFTRGSGEHRIVVIKQGSQPTDPADGKSYTANAGYKLGDSTGAASYVVYNGLDSAVTISKLTPNRSYTVNVYEYNGDGSACDYLTYPVLTATFTTPATARADKAVINKTAITSTSASLYPNPVLDECVVTFTAAAKQAYTIDVLDIKGNVLLRKKVQAAKGSNKTGLNTTTLAAGIYMVSIADENGNRQNLKLVKQ